MRSQGEGLRRECAVGAEGENNLGEEVGKRRGVCARHGESGAMAGQAVRSAGAMQQRRLLC